MKKEGKFIESHDGLNLFYRIHRGKKKPFLVFLHGVGCNWTVWKEELEFFEKKGHSTLAPDARGHGKSDLPEDMDKYYFPNFARDLKLILETEKIKEFILIGHSMGGGIALKYCYDYAKDLPKKMILIETSYRYPYPPDQEFYLNPYITNLFRFLSSHQSLRNNHFPHMKEIDFTKGIKHNDIGIFIESLQVTPLKSILACLDSVQQFSFNHLQDAEKMLKHLNIPVLILAGRLDSTVPLEYSEELHNLIKKSKLEIVDGWHHRIIIEEPKEVAIHILKFIK